MTNSFIHLMSILLFVLVVIDNFENLFQYLHGIYDLDMMADKAGQRM